MIKRKYIQILLVAVLMVFCFKGTLRAQNVDALGSYTPYSLFGIGQLAADGTAYNMSMGGIGIGMRDNGYINYINPASITARDTLAFMLDFGINQKNMYNSDGKTLSAYNVFNMQNVVLTVPIYRTSALMVGIAPFSDVGYKFISTETDDALESEIGDIKYQKYGTGSLYKVFVAASVMFWKRLSIGAEGIYYFGYIDRHSDILFNSSPSYNTIYTGWEYKVHSFSGKFGLQYIQPFKKSESELVIGGTYRLGNNLRGDIKRYAYSDNGAIDTIVYGSRENVGLQIADEFGVGISFRKKDKWVVGFDYIQQNWHNSSFAHFDKDIKFTPSTARYYKLGFEYTPNKYDIRYYMKRVSYRVGAYFEESYITLNGHQVNSFGLTLGMSLPIYRNRNAVSVAINMGQRGTLKYNMIRERYINFSVSVNLHDIWFVKYRYD